MQYLKEIFMPKPNKFHRFVAAAFVASLVVLNAQAGDWEVFQQGVVDELREAGLDASYFTTSMQGVEAPK